jgi:hypothetical protein
MTCVKTRRAGVVQAADGDRCRRVPERDVAAIERPIAMSLVSSVASALTAVLPRQLRFPSPRKSVAARDFDALIRKLSRANPTSAGWSGAAALSVTPLPLENPTRALVRRARN